MAVALSARWKVDNVEKKVQQRQLEFLDAPTLLQAAIINRQGDLSARGDTVKASSYNQSSAGENDNKVTSIEASKHGHRDLDVRP